MRRGGGRTREGREPERLSDAIEAERRVATWSWGIGKYRSALIAMLDDIGPTVHPGGLTFPCGARENIDRLPAPHSNLEARRCSTRQMGPGTHMDTRRGSGPISCRAGRRLIGSVVYTA